MKRRILLISPAADHPEKYPNTLRIPEISLATIAAFTPEQYEVQIVEEEIEPIDFECDYDLVGISCMTANAPRAYEVATRFKNRGIPVVFGGIHPTVLPQEALQYGDAVVIGEAEGAWERLLQDFEQGQLKPTYRVYQPKLDEYPIPDRSHAKKRGVFGVKPITTTRGCPYNCDFCCVPEFFGPKLRHIPIERVCQDIEASGGGNYIFLDDNIIGHPQYAKQLFQAIAPYKIKWVGQASVSFVKDAELMELAQKSGCVCLFFGLESVTKSQTDKMRKSIKDIDKLEESIKKVKDMGIHFHASMVFGFDEDTLAVFDETLDFLWRTRIGTVSFNVLTPYPGTLIYKRFKEEGRIITEDWRYYDHCTVTYRPRKMTPMQLAEGYQNMKAEFYKMSNIMKRFPSNMRHPLLYLATSMGYRVGVKSGKQQLNAKMNQIFMPQR